MSGDTDPREAPTPGEAWEAMEESLAVEKRQADALEALADQTRVQNAVTLELVHELTALRRLQAGDRPFEFSAEGKAGAVEDRALELAERVDLDAVDLWTDEEPLTDGGAVEIAESRDEKVTVEEPYVVIETDDRDGWLVAIDAKVTESGDLRYTNPDGRHGALKREHWEAAEEKPPESIVSMYDDGAFGGGAEELLRGLSDDPSGER
ncbi:hypothetical protein [Halosimplex pelagicum]|uniref:Uncharacterized protein n=1 Tax=Halosimplex pelagicum TaxID=869886 RepID=A0A7D5P8H2_9EURY|nr:hypothetical protein [Halosimplex pelagicum]QLH83343.1 hypothetical protein HZS54_17650 [Halosimplex pelagicum]